MKICIDCHKEEVLEGQKRCYRCSELLRLKHKRHSDNNKLKAIQFFGNKCNDCNLEISILDVYDFHHINPNEKSCGLSNLFGRKGWDQIQKELDKCILLCANCHRIRHFYLRKERDNTKPLIKIRPFNVWTNEEIKILKQVYLNNDDKNIIIKHLPNRTWSQIQHKANSLNIKKEKYTSRQGWLDEEIKILLDNYENIDNNELVKLLPHRTIRGIKDQMRRMNIKVIKEKNIKLKDALFLLSKKGKTNKEISNELDISMTCFYYVLHKIPLKERINVGLLTTKERQSYT